MNTSFYVLYQNTYSINRKEMIDMPSLFNYHIFISHAWSYSEDYIRLVQLLDNAPYFSYYDYSISSDKNLSPLGIKIPDSRIKQALQNQISHSTVVLTLLGMYGAYHKWMNTEAGLACALNKPLIGIKPWGQQRIPQDIALVCDEIVGWNTDSIIDAIRRANINK